MPDGVASVVLHYGDHPNQTETVTENAFSFRVLSRTSRTDHQRFGPTESRPHPGASHQTPELPTSIVWLNAHGEVISTHTNSNVVSTDHT